MFYKYIKLIGITTSVFSEKQLVVPILGTRFIVKRQHLLPFFVLSLMVTYDKYAPTKLKTRALQLLPFDDKSIYRDNDIISVVFLFLL